MSKLQVTTDVPNEIKMVRVLNAPRRLVIQAMSTPELVKRWIGGGHTNVISIEIDYRVGGKYRQVFGNPDGGTFSFSGEYKELSDERVVQTQSFNDDPNGVLLTTTLVEKDGKTTLTAIMRCDSQATRDMIVGTGMETGASASYDALDKVLASL